MAIKNFCAMIVYRIVGNKKVGLELEFLLTFYRDKKGTMDIKFPGGLDKPGEIPVVAAVRELREETGLEADELFAQHVFTKNIDSNFALQFFMVPMEQVGGNMITRPRSPSDQGFDQENIGVPVWMQFNRHLLDPILYPDHAEALIAALKQLAKVNSDLFFLITRHVRLCEL
ncbi:MAG: NUDIX domain-containing protein [bacterium]